MDPNTEMAYSGSLNVGGFNIGYSQTVVQSGPLSWISANRALALLGASALAFVLGNRTVALTLAAVAAGLYLLDAQPAAGSGLTISTNGTAVQVPLQ